MPSTVYHVHVLMLTNSDTTILHVLEHSRIELLCAFDNLKNALRIVNHKVKLKTMPVSNHPSTWLKCDL